MGEKQASPSKFNLLSASQETPFINDSLEVLEDLLVEGNGEEVRNIDLLQEIYLNSFPNVKERLLLLMSNYQDNEKVFHSLLDLHERLEAINREYQKRLATRIPSMVTRDTKPIITSLLDVQSESEGEEEPLKLKGKGKEKIKVGASISEVKKEINEEEEGDEQVNSKTSENLNSSQDSSNDKNNLEASLVGYILPEGPSTCPICFLDDIQPNEFYIFSQCKHGYCMECLESYFSNRINEGKVLDIKCPFPACTTIIEYHQIQDVVSDELFNRYEEFTFLASLNQDPTLRWCPKPGCGNAMFFDPDHPECKCTQCNYEFCGNCKEPAHKGTCEEYQQWKEDNGLVDKKYENWARKNTKRCPNCKTPIEKANGCNHMTCSNCNYQYCWLCGGKYTSSHFDIYNLAGCPGMQSGSRQYGVLKRMGLRALIGTGMIVGGAVVAALALPAAIVAGPIYGGYRIHKRRVRSRRYR